MGIRNLTVFIKNNKEEALKGCFSKEPEQLENIVVILDGLSIAHKAREIGSSSNEQNMFGGDYDDIKNDYEKFFELLEKHEITPIVVLDGSLLKNKKLKLN